MKFQKPIKYAFSLAFAALLLYAAFNSVDWVQFGQGVKECRWVYIAVGMAASVAAFFFRARRWRILMLPFDSGMDTLTAFNGVNIGYLANFAFPRIGEVVRCGFVSRRSKERHQDSSDGQGISFEHAVGTVLLSRVWDMLMVFVLIGVLLALRWHQFGDFFVNKIFGPARDKFGSAGLWIMLAALAAAGVLTVFLLRKYRHSNPIASKIHGFLSGILKGFKSFTHMDHKVAFLGYTVLLWAMYWLMSMCVLWAMPQMDGLTWIDAWFVCLVGSVAWMIPVPGGFGAYHWLVALGISSIYAMSWDTGVLCATLNHEAQALTMLLCGAVSYIVELIRK